MLETIRQGGVPYRRPASRQAAFTDMQPEDLLAVVEEAKDLIEAGRFYPLLPHEFVHIWFPPPDHRPSADYRDFISGDGQLENVDWTAARDTVTLAHDLTLLRLDKNLEANDRAALRNQLARAREGSQ